ncbi:MAG TPA: sigma-70 family RNA polymerase sigma factor [Verrucomicrobiae bacterium]|nr:sigma-70 family RNA polymerase sigma factor [Verrucomicrobiae bacterium]
MNPPEVQQLLSIAREGDAEAFCELCRFFETRLLRHALTLCGNATLAEDLAEDTLVEAWKCLRRYNQKCQFFTWLCAILLNRYRNTLRQKRAVSFSSLQNDDSDGVQISIENMPDANSTPDDAAQRREQSDLILRCIQALPDKHREVIYLRFYVDNSLEGIAAAAGCSLGTVKSRLFRALENLREMPLLQTHYHELEKEVGTL